METPMKPIVILGAGYTGSRVAVLLREGGHEVLALRSRDLDFTDPSAVESLARLLPEGCAVLHSVPPLPLAADRALLGALPGKARRVVYLSTTGVYGEAELVNESTPVAARTEREAARIATETAVAQGPWSALILRPAAIYGPDRGVHVAMRQGRYTMIGDGSNYISRIHVDDLARIATAGLLSDLDGAYPVADEHPCPSREIADYCARTFSLPPPLSAPVSDVPVSRRNNRRVDGRAICKKLGVKLRYPSYLDALTPDRVVWPGEKLK
jgi:nucleoside-diphosphate-sugar epimerase